MVTSALATGDAPNTLTVVLIVVTRTWVHTGAIQVQIVRIDVIVRSRRPIVAVATPTAGRRHTEVAGVEEVIREVSG